MDETVKRRTMPILLSAAYVGWLVVVPGWLPGKQTLALSLADVLLGETDKSPGFIFVSIRTGTWRPRTAPRTLRR